MDPSLFTDAKTALCLPVYRKEAYAKRTTFHPSTAYYSMKFDNSRNVILAAMPLVAVYNITRDGKILWEAGRQPQGGADKIDFGVPRDVAVDS